MNAYEIQAYVLENSIGNLYWKGRDGRFLGCNKTCAAVAGLASPADVVGKSIEELFFHILSKEEIQKLLETDESVMSLGVEKIVEEVGLDSGGAPAYYITKKSPIRDHSGDVIGLAGVSIDVTKQKEAEKLKIDFIHNLEHDIRTPFCGIVSMTEILLHQEKDAEKKLLIGDILSSANELLDYCNSVLIFSNFQKNTQKNELIEFDVKKLLDSIFAMQLSAAKAKKLYLELTCSSDMPKMLVGSPIRLKQMLINLVGNAVKFTEKGHVKIEVQLLPEKKDTSVPEKCYVAFRIEDTGIGIPREKQHLVTEKFFTLDQSNTVSHKNSGLGLGLAIVKEIVEDFNGELIIKSEVGKGSVFTCIIPLGVSS